MFMRQSFVSFLVLFVFAVSVCAAVPQTISHQGYLAGSGGVAVNGSVQMVFSIYNVESGGVALWTETQTVQVNNGIYAVALGAVSPIDPAIIDGNLWLGVKVGDDAEMTPRQKLSSVPFAITASGFSGVLAGDVVGNQNSTTVEKIRGAEVAATAPAVGQALMFDGAKWVPSSDGAGLAGVDAAKLGGKDAAAFVTVEGADFSGKLNLPDNGLTVGAGQLDVTSGVVNVGTAENKTDLKVSGNLSSGNVKYIVKTPSSYSWTGSYSAAVPGLTVNLNEATEGVYLILSGLSIYSSTPYTLNSGAIYIDGVNVAMNHAHQDVSNITVFTIATIGSGAHTIQTKAGGSSSGGIYSGNMAVIRLN